MPEPQCQMEESDQLHNLISLLLAKRTPLHSEPRLDKLQSQPGHFGERSLFPAGNQPPDCPVYSLVTIPTILPWFLSIKVTEDLFFVGASKNDNLTHITPNLSLYRKR